MKQSRVSVPAQYLLQHQLLAGILVFKYTAPNINPYLCYFLSELVRFTLRLAVYSRHLGAQPLEAHDQFFFQRNHNDHSRCVTSTLARRWICLLWICSAFRQTCSMMLQMSFDALCIQVLWQSRLSKAGPAYLIYHIRGWLSHLNVRSNILWRIYSLLGSGSVYTFQRTQQ
jgi:hypothetical protein